MLKLDHLAIWTAHREQLARRLSELTGLPVLDGFAPNGRMEASGVRLAGGAFLDLHDQEVPGGPGEVFLGLRGSVDAAEALATREGWRVRVGRWHEATDGSPWSMLTFRRDHGVLNKIFVIEYAQEPGAWTSPAFNQPLYRTESTPAEGASLSRVWLGAVDEVAADAALKVLGFTPADEIVSAFAPGTGRLYRGAQGDLVLVPAPADAVIRFDIDAAGPAVAEAFGERLTLVTGETPVTSP